MSTFLPSLIVKWLLLIHPKLAYHMAGIRCSDQSETDSGYSSVGLLRFQTFKMLNLSAPNSDVKPPFQATPSHPYYCRDGFSKQKSMGHLHQNGWWGQFKSTSQGSSPRPPKQNLCDCGPGRWISTTSPVILSTLKFERYWGAEERAKAQKWENRRTMWGEPEVQECKHVDL